MAIDFEFSRFEIPLKELPSGETLQLNVFRMVSAIPGPFVHIQANIHGAEIQGNAVIYQLMSYFKNHPFRGTLQFIPQCNPMALNHKEGTHTLGRFSPVTGDNWNRNYADLSHKSFEEIAFDFKTFTQSHTSASWDHIKKDFKHHLQMAAEKIIQNTMPYRLADHKLLALKLQSLAAPADIVLDLHTGPVATRYLYAAEYTLESAKHFAFPFLLIIPTDFAGAMDEACFGPWVELKKSFNHAGHEVPLEFESFTVELGSEEQLNFAQAEKDTAHILNYLAHKDILQSPPDFTSPVQKILASKLENYKTYYAAAGGLYEFCKRPGDFVAAGEVLARILSFKGVESPDDLPWAVQEIKAHNDAFVINHCPSGVLAEGMDLYQVLEKCQEI